MKQLGKALLQGMLGMYSFFYRISGGRMGGSMGRLGVLLLTTTGRKSGAARTVPLGYFEHDGGYVLAASNAGAKSNPGWYFNLQSDPKASIQVKDRKMQATAEMVGADQYAALWARLIQLSPAYGAYPARSGRQIPLIIMRPAKPVASS